MIKLLTHDNYKEQNLVVTISDLSSKIMHMPYRTTILHVKFWFATIADHASAAINSMSSKSPLTDFNSVNQKEVVSDILTSLKKV